MKGNRCAGWAGLIILNTVVWGAIANPIAAKTLPDDEFESLAPELSESNSHRDRPLFEGLDLPEPALEGDLNAPIESAQIPTLSDPVPLPPGAIPLPPPSQPPADAPSYLSPTFGIDSPIPPQTNFPSQFELDYNSQFSRYRLGVGDAIALQVSGFPEFDFQGQINIEGNIVVPILGPVPVVGLTLDEVSEKVSFELGRQYLKQQPDITTVLLTPRPATITVIGEVVQPGFYNVVPGTEVDEAIIAAGGSQSNADLRSVVVRRTLIDGTVLEREINIFTALQNGTTVPPLLLQDGDAVFVPKIEQGTDQDYDRQLVANSSISKPDLAIRILSYPNQAIGEINLPNGSTLLDAIASISPDLQNTDLGDVRLLRFDPEQGRVVAQELDALDAIRGDISQDIPLQDEDVLVLDRTTIAKIDNVLNLVTSPVQSLFNLIFFLRDSVRQTVPDFFRGR
jgi:polysaccharide export outer membrane protein